MKTVTVTYKIKLNLKLLSQSWQILIPKMKPNQNKQYYFTDNHYQQNTSQFFIGVVEKCETNTRVLRSWKDFPVYKYSGISYDVHLARSRILILSVKFSLINGYLFIFTENAQLLSQAYGMYLGVGQYILFQIIINSFFLLPIGPQ